MLHARIIVRITCSQPQCGESYEVALSLPTIVTIATGPSLNNTALPAPTGWVVNGELALCPAHSPAAQGQEQPTPEVLKRAAALQALAQDPKTTDGERRNAWAQFEKLWKRYRLPEDLGL